MTVKKVRANFYDKTEKKELSFMEQLAMERKAQEEAEFAEMLRQEEEEKKRQEEELARLIAEEEKQKKTGSN